MDMCMYHVAWSQAFVSVLCLATLLYDDPISAAVTLLRGGQRFELLIRYASVLAVYVSLQDFKVAGGAPCVSHLYLMFISCVSRYRISK